MRLPDTLYYPLCLLPRAFPVNSPFNRTLVSEQGSGDLPNAASEETRTVTFVSGVGLRGTTKIAAGARPSRNTKAGTPEAFRPMQEAKWRVISGAAGIRLQTTLRCLAAQHYAETQQRAADQTKRRRLGGAGALEEILLPTRYSRTRGDRTDR